MTIDPALATIIVAILVNLPAWFISRSTARKLKSEQDAAMIKAQADAATESDKREQLKDDLTEKVLKRADTEIDKYKARVEKLEENLETANELIEQLRAGKRESDQKVMNLEQALTDRDRKFNADLTAERAARQDLECRLTDAQQRISSLEDELDKRNRRIKELEDRATSK